MGVRRRVGRWALVAVAVPMAAKVADQVGRRIEDRQGPNKWSRGLRRSASQLRRVQGRRR
ncbi:MAG TPA: hypothetical protein VEG38_08765 [Acidimicrobiia bacterium]|nr:hypothetical protein [Acidimicrobiia bacterium]